MCGLLKMIAFLRAIQSCARQTKAEANIHLEIYCREMLL